MAERAAQSLTPEDLRRASDRRRVWARRSVSGPRFGLLWLLVGPGILVMLGENDAPSMLAYAAAGAQFGIGFFLPFVVLTFLMAYVVQEMTLRLGAVTHRGHAELIFERFGGFWGWFAMGDLLVGNFLTLVTEFIGVRAGLGFFGVPPYLAVLGALALVVAASLTGRYWTWERIALGLALLNLVFVPVALLAHPNFGAIGHSFLTWGPLAGGLRPSTMLVLVSAIGATVTPWMLFFQQSAVVDKGLTPADLRHGRIDTAIGAGVAALAAIATIVATSVLFGGTGSTRLQAAADFAQAIQSHVGYVGAALFALGIFEAGLVAAITISASSAYAFGEVLGGGHSLYRRVGEARTFYGVLLLLAALAAAFVLIPGLPLEFIVLIVNVIAVLAMPPALVLLYLLANDGEVMGKWRNSRAGNVVTAGIVIFLVGAGLSFALSVLDPRLFGG
ncbi:MAG: NRAMP family divalent metal transporter [Candidatus Dormibacteria bacterium]